MRRTTSIFDIRVLLDEDGFYSILKSDIKGLFLEVDSRDELQSELCRVAPKLLKSNHGIEASQMNDVLLYVSIVQEGAKPRARSRGPRVAFEQSAEMSLAC